MADQGSSELVNYYAKISILIAMMFALAACEVIVPKQIEVDEAEVLELYKDVPLKDVMNNVQKKFARAKNEEIYFYSPNNYKTARTGIQVARANFRNPDKRTYVLKSLHRSDKALDDAFEVKVIVEKELAEHIKMRNFLLNVDAKKSHTREYRSLITSLMSIIERIENEKEKVINNPEKKKDLDERKKDMLDDLVVFRLKVVKFRYLNFPEQLVSESDTYDARSLAPDTYARTISARDAAVKYISENVENLEGIEDVSGKFQYEAERLLHITRAVDTLLKLDKDKYENYVLSHEENYQLIRDALKEPELKYLSFSAQARRYASSIKRIVKEKQDNALKIAELKSGGGDSNANSQASAQPEVNSSAEGQGQQDEKKGVEIVPIAADGDPNQMRRSLTILTDQVYQLTVEKTAWENERAKLKAEIKKLKETKQAKPKVKAKPEKKQEPETAKNKEEPKKEQVKPEPKAESKMEEKAAEDKTTGETAKTQ